MQFSDTTNKTGIIEAIERATNTQSATTSSYPLKVKTLDVNQALANFFILAQSYSNTWKVDDTNNSAEPSYSQNLVNGTGTYTILNDSGSNEITAIERVDILDSNGNSKRLKLFNRQLITEQGLVDFEENNGEPEYYELVGKFINLKPAPNYNSTNGLKVYNERGGSYFISTDTTKTPGIPVVFHDYLWVRPSFLFSSLKGLSNAKALQIHLDKIEDDIKNYYQSRLKDSQKNNETNRMNIYNQVKI